MKMWEKILLYPISFYVWLTDGSKKWKNAMALLLVAVMLCGMLPVSAMADSVGVAYLDSTGASQTCEEYTTLSDETTLTSGWYYVTGDITISSRITVTGDVHLILGDGCTLTVDMGIKVADGNSLSIYAQSTGDNMGRLTTQVDSGWNAGIGSNSGANAGDITINGGNITAQGGAFAAGIGGGSSGRSGKITINGGIVTATGGSWAAGIGGGSDAENGPITINGGTITATGGTRAAAIGGGSYAYGRNITINGGTIVANAGWLAACIGGGDECGSSMIVINGGSITANRNSGAAIGGGSGMPAPSTVSFAANGGTGTMENIPYVSGNLYLPANEFTAPAGKLFAGWDVNGVQYMPGEAAYIKSDVTINAMWSDKIYIAFTANGGTGEMDDVILEAAGNYTLPKCSFTAPEGKIFKTWSVNGQELAPGEEIFADQATLITAIWKNITKYDLWVGGVQVSDANADNITGEGITGKVYYDHETATLTLEDATITSVYVLHGMETYGIKSGMAVTIQLIGNNTVSCIDKGDYSYGDNYGISIRELTFTGDGNLTVYTDATSATIYSYGIKAYISVTVNSTGTIIAYCGKTSKTAYGLRVDYNDLTLANPNLVAVGNKNGNDDSQLEAVKSLYQYKYVKIVAGGKVVLNVNKGTINAGEMNYYLQEGGATLPTDVTRDGYIFGGWYDNANFAGDAVTEIPVGSAGNKEFWAKWILLHTCVLETVKEEAPTCTENGKRAYYKCDGCGKFYEDAAGTIEITNIDSWGILAKLGHTESADWKTDGESHWKVCSAENCGVVIEGSKVAHTSTGANVATCTKLAVCDVCGVSYGDYAAHSYTAQIKNENTLKSAGNCRDKAVYWYSCAACGKVEKNDNHTFTGDKVADAHVGGTTLVNQAAANHKTQTDGYTGDTKCLGCGEILSYGQVIPAGAHTPANAWTTDGESHWKVCSAENCGVVIEGSKAAHTSTGANVATCQKKAVCDACGVSYGEVAKHVPAAVLSKDGTGHWYACQSAGCAEKLSFAAHTPDHEGGATEEYAVACTGCGWIMEQQLAHTHVFDQEAAQEQYLVSQATCNEPAKYYKSCKCGETGTEIFESGSALGHTAGTQWKSDEDNHWNECACGEKLNTAAHADDNADGACDVCAYEVDQPKQPDDTGDNAMILWVVLVCISGAMLALVVVDKKRKNSAV